MASSYLAKTTNILARLIKADDVSQEQKSTLVRSQQSRYR